MGSTNKKKNIFFLFYLNKISMQNSALAKYSYLFLWFCFSHLNDKFVNTNIPVFILFLFNSFNKNYKSIYKSVKHDAISCFEAYDLVFKSIIHSYSHPHTVAKINKLKLKIIKETRFFYLCITVPNLIKCILLQVRHSTHKTILNTYGIWFLYFIFTSKHNNYLSFLSNVVTTFIFKELCITNSFWFCHFFNFLNNVHKQFFIKVQNHWNNHSSKFCVLFKKNVNVLFDSFNIIYHRAVMQKINSQVYKKNNKKIKYLHFMVLSSSYYFCTYRSLYKNIQNLINSFCLSFYKVAYSFEDSSYFNMNNLPVHNIKEKFTQYLFYYSWIVWFRQLFWFWSKTLVVTATSSRSNSFVSMYTFRPYKKLFYGSSGLLTSKKFFKSKLSKILRGNLLPIHKKAKVKVSLNRSNFAFFLTTKLLVKQVIKKFKKHRRFLKKKRRRTKKNSILLIKSLSTLKFRFLSKLPSFYRNNLFSPQMYRFANVLKQSKYQNFKVKVSKNKPETYKSKGLLLHHFNNIVKKSLIPKFIYGDSSSFRFSKVANSHIWIRLALFIKKANIIDNRGDYYKMHINNIIKLFNINNNFLQLLFYNKNNTVQIFFDNPKYGLIKKSFDKYKNILNERVISYRLPQKSIKFRKKKILKKVSKRKKLHCKLKNRKDFLFLVFKLKSFLIPKFFKSNFGKRTSNFKKLETRVFTRFTKGLTYVFNLFKKKIHVSGVWITYRNPYGHGNKSKYRFRRKKVKRLKTF